MTTITEQSVAEVVRDAMKDAKINQRQLANQTGIPLVTLARRLSGGSQTFNVPELAAIGQVVGLSVVELAVRIERRCLDGS
jgi:hypothetical protein